MLAKNVAIVVSTEDLLKGPDRESEFERFEDTLSKLAQVPKSEVDEKRKEP